MAKRNVVAVREAWRAKKSKQVVFHHENGVFWLRSDDLTQVLRIGLVQSNADAVGFLQDGWLTQIIGRLIEARYTVAVAEGQTLRTVRLPSRSLKPDRIESRVVGLAPELLLGARELAELTSKLMKQAESESAVRQLREQLLSDEGKSAAFYGPIYVYQLAEAIYEVDWELTRVPERFFQMLLVAAHQGKRLLRCHLLAPKGRRATRSGRDKARLLTASEPVTYGQLRLQM